MDVQIRFSDPFDERHYPLEERHIAVVGKLAERFGQREWWYQATLQGRVFWFRSATKYPKLDRDEMEFLLSLPGFRWLQHQQGETTFSRSGSSMLFRRRRKGVASDR